MMNPCRNCKSSRWKFSFNDATGKIRAECRTCNSFVEFFSRRAKKVRAGIEIGTGMTVEFATINGEVCRKENGEFKPVEWKTFKDGSIQLVVKELRWE